MSPKMKMRKRKSHFLTPVLLLQLLVAALVLAAGDSGGLFHLTVTDTTTGSLPIFATTNMVGSTNFITNYLVVNPSMTNDLTFQINPDDTLTNVKWDFHNAAMTNLLEGNSVAVRLKTPLITSKTEVTISCTRNPDGTMVCKTKDHPVVMLLPNYITRDGNMVNSTNNTVWVGQQINLTNYISTSIPASAITSYQWHIPGANNTANDTAFYDYKPNTTSSNYTNLFTPTNYTTNNYCNFYWSSGGSNQVVTCTEVIYGQTNTVTATFNVSRPTDIITTPQIATIKVDTGDSSYSPQPALYFGDIVTGTIPGITFTNAAPSASILGNNLWVQIINSAVITALPSTGSVPVFHSGVDSAKGFPYPSLNGGLDTQDSPDLSLPFPTSLTNVSYNFRATMYLMWQPNSSHGDKTVMVPLKAYPWHWGGTAVNTSGTWTGPESPSYPPTNAANVDVTNEPVWTTSFGTN